ncbi:MAG: hypothetical protein EZS28_004412 [Streblomastix strix]|uniref:Uncharacterized protein n=1 Tax=Streblomastix strix TaxID=222440 RepID=A0A5J4WYZ4_9EUKA|nr:MAG: hypothetical protein EZS28_004412 [Streblomastix strix]
MAGKYFRISEVHVKLNQLEVQYDPKSTKPVLEQLLLQRIKAYGQNGPKSSITKISEFVHKAVATKNEQFALAKPDRVENDEQNNDTINDTDKVQDELIQLQQQRIKATQELELAAEKLDEINNKEDNEKSLTNQRCKEITSRVKGQIQNSHKNYPIIIRDNSSLKPFKDRIHDMFHEDQSPLHQYSNIRKVALYSFVIIVYELPLGTKLRHEIQWFNEHDYTRSIDCEYNICWFIAASFQRHPEINQTKTRIANAIELFLQFHEKVHKNGSRLNKQQKQMLKDYEGFSQDTDLEKFQQCFKLNVMTYEYDHSEKQFNKTNEYIVDQEQVTTHILLAPLTIQGDENPQVHAMFIKDIDRVVG